MIVDDARHLVPLGDLDPVATVSLTDAGLTPYHAIVSSLDALPAGSTAVVIGAGGLGHVGIQILRAITGATVVALDVERAEARHWPVRWARTTCCTPTRRRPARSAR